MNTSPTGKPFRIRNKNTDQILLVQALPSLGPNSPWELVSSPDDDVPPDAPLAEVDEQDSSGHPD